MKALALRDVSIQRQHGHLWPQVGAANADVDDGADAAAGVPEPRAAAQRVGKGGQREYLFPESRETYLRSKVDTAVADALAKLGPKTDSPEAAKARLANAQADMVEFQLAQKRSEYVSLAYHLREQDAQASRLVLPLSQLHQRYRTPSLGLTDATVDAFWLAVEDWLRAQAFEAVTRTDEDDLDPADVPPAEAA
jgi:phage terminase Nu1 subunit (DNA packaging protein)